MNMKKMLLLFTIFMEISLLIGCASKTDKTDTFGVFLNYEGDLKDLGQYETVVIDAQYIEAQDIKAFQEQGHRVYSYINVGSLENFRDYYASNGL